MLKDSSLTATTTVDSEAVQQIRTLLAQGYRIGIEHIEHVDQRRFKTGSWQSCRIRILPDKSRR